jgi:hypothetical protein
MANIIYINDLRPNRDPEFIRTPIGYVANDSTSRPILGMGDKLQLDIPPLTAGDFGRIRSSIEGIDEFSWQQRDPSHPDLEFPEISNRSIYNYSDIDKGQIQYYIDTDFVNPFQPFFKDNNHLSFKEILPDRTIEYTRQAIVPIQRDTSLDPVYDQKLLRLENASIYSGSPMGKTFGRNEGGMQFSAAEARMGPNELYNPNQWFVDTQNQREDVQALQMRTMIRHNYAPAQLFS